jgi:hypothetical protein
MYHLADASRSNPLLKGCLGYVPNFLLSPAPVPETAAAKQKYQYDYNNEERCCIHNFLPCFPFAAVR